ncbi:hypothetical protein EJ05DRAFT_493396 [Pseudovirgaria hyperparasitica]|uniref:CNH domain-containing protein n=1 Tax=Pseudovirgaria hyperparasitica TaxID=470096 RepID=A0A6A6W6X4_9PEZI|nr:uncharacterized protein EJ05DRAFT_493396 [Pseudovirgaria hyperparasitica]KAF2756831.1 hypothetical protein EJ05DRAFT_493396 [Pseudovirgaria hyperparasitica]
MASSPARQSLVHDVIHRHEDGTFVLRKLISDVPLSADGQTSDIRITCVEVYNENLYIGTSAAEILHFVLIPAEPDDASDEPTPMLASRQQPAYAQDLKAGIQQILLLPKVNKACIICNNTLTFYSLPELSPAFPSTKPIACTHVGGVDQNLEEDDEDNEDSMAILMAQKNNLRMVRVTEEGPRSKKSVQYGGCLVTRRRGDIACAADQHSYALLDVDQQQKVPLFPISTLDEEASGIVAGPTQDISTSSGHHTPSKSMASTQGLPARGQPEGRTHGRSTSLGIFGDQRKLESPRPGSQSRYAFDAPDFFSRSRSPFPVPTPDDRSPERGATPAPGPEGSDKPLPARPVEHHPESEPISVTPPEPLKKFVPLMPHIISPTPNEFLLTTGTTPEDRGVGSFVNLDGDPSRGTMEFSSYPISIISDGRGIDPSSSMGPGETPEEGYVLAMVYLFKDEQHKVCVEVQRWDTEPGESASLKEWIDISTVNDTSHPNISAGMSSMVVKTGLILPELGQKLTPRQMDLRGLTSEKLVPVRSSSLKSDDQGAKQYAERLSQWQARSVLWSSNNVWWIVRNPMILKLDARLYNAQHSETADSKMVPNREQIELLLNDLHGLQGWTEVDYLGLGYIRQKASLLLFMDLIIRTISDVLVFEKDKRSTEEALIQGEVDPRIILALLPQFKDEVVQGPSGISILGGLKSTIEAFLGQYDVTKISRDPKSPFGDNLLQLIRRYLGLWRQKKGMASIADDKEVFQTVDAALLHILLLLDRHSTHGPSTNANLRKELNSLLDGGVDCFERAVELLEQYQRLFLLSRLYMSKRLVGKVLETWRRILEGENDEGGEFADGEIRMRKHLAEVRDPALMEEYGTWLANRNPKLGVELFADDNARVKFEPARAVEILKARAPGAVKEYLEYLVFGKKLSKYANDLIGFYLDSVIEQLSSSPETRTILLQTYETYRALRPHKPTYRQFITENSLGVEWWDNRLRLLQLLGSATGSAVADYDVVNVMSRLKAYENELVPEMIVLSGRQGEHDSAIRLLTHGLGDFDTAVNYCLLGGSSIFRPSLGYVPDNAMPSREEQGRLFKVLLAEFLKIEDLGERIERTGELLERFGGWFDVMDVLSQVPDEWSVEIFGGFLVSALRELVRDRHESEVVKALNGAVNLRSSADLIEKTEAEKPTLETVK